MPPPHLALKPTPEYELPAEDDLVDQQLKVVFNDVRLLTNENVENDRECEETSQSEVVACKKIAKLKI